MATETCLFYRLAWLYRSLIIFSARICVEGTSVEIQNKRNVPCNDGCNLIEEALFDENCLRRRLHNLEEAECI